MSGGYETKLFERMRRWVSANLPGALLVKNHGNPYQPVGRPDCELLVPASASRSGRAECWWLELKRPGRDASPAQARWLRVASAAGARTAVVHDLAEFAALVGGPGADPAQNP